jgi:hypothetical protein
MMKYLIAIPNAKAMDDKWTTRREPVVPCFPSQHGSAFLTVPSFLLANKAEVSNTDVDADEIAEALVKEYPGLPRALHENYVLTVWKAVYDIPLGTVFRVSVSQRQAILIDDKTNGTIVLWNSQPLK